MLKCQKGQFRPANNIQSTYPLVKYTTLDFFLLSLITSKASGPDQWLTFSIHLTKYSSGIIDTSL